MKTSSAILVVSAISIGIVLAAISGYTYYDYYGRPRCMSCGMILRPEAHAQWDITLPNGDQLHACCPACALRIASLYPTMHLETYDDWYGPSAKIVIDISDGKIESINPPTVKFLMGYKVVKSCANNRIAINDTSAELLLENGYNPRNTYSTFSTSLPEGTPVLDASEALEKELQIGVKYSPPSSLFLAGVAVTGVVVLLISAFFGKRFLEQPRRG